MEYISVTAVTAENYQKLARTLHRRRTGSPEGASPEAVPACLDNPDYFLYAVEVDGEFTAYISASIIPKPDSRIGTMFVDELWVEPDHRRAGYARALLRKLDEDAQQRNLWRTRLYVSTSNEGGIRLYESEGMTRSGGTAFFMEKACAPIRESF